MIRAVIFNLDGVLVRTDECHYLAWKRMADEQGIPFDREINARLQGMKRMDSLRILLKKAERLYSPAEMFALAARKNDLFNDLISRITPGSEQVQTHALETVRQLRRSGIKTAVASSSENATGILRHLKLDSLFDVIVDGGQIEKGKPDPEVFLTAAEKMRVEAESCLAVEDSIAGVEGARRCGMRVLALGRNVADEEADFWADSLEEIDFPLLVAQALI